jgi:hypothetical protein
MSDKKENSSSLAALLDEQSKPTETKEVGRTLSVAEGSTGEAQEAENQGTPKVNPEDFDGHDIQFNFNEEEEFAPHTESDAERSRSAQEEEPPEEEIFDPEQAAENNIIGLNTIIGLLSYVVLTMKGKRKIGKGEKWEKALDLKDEVHSKAKLVDQLSPEEKKTFYQIDRVFKKIDQSGLNEHDKKVIRDPMIAYVKQNGFKSSPGLNLAIAFGSIAFSKAMILLSD